jgi:hypothetical protein
MISQDTGQKSVQYVPVFSSKTFLNAENVSKARQASLQVELGALSKECGLAIVIQFEERGPSFDLRLHQTWWSYFEQTVSR